MSSRLSLVALAVTSALCGALAHRAIVGDGAAVDLSMVTARSARLDRRIAAQEANLDLERKSIDALRDRNDSLIDDRWRLRILKADERRLPDKTTEHRSAPAVVATGRLVRARMTQVDDRLLAELMRERRKSEAIHSGYEELAATYRLQLQLEKQEKALLKKAHRRSRRRTILVTAAVAAAAGYLVASN